MHEKVGRIQPTLIVHLLIKSKDDRTNTSDRSGKKWSNIEREQQPKELASDGALKSIEARTSLQ